MGILYPNHCSVSNVVGEYRYTNGIHICIHLALINGPNLVSKWPLLLTSLYINWAIFLTWTMLSWTRIRSYHLGPGRSGGCLLSVLVARPGITDWATYFIYYANLVSFTDSRHHSSKSNKRARLNAICYHICLP
jgi:hypothetical protein